MKLEKRRLAGLDSCYSVAVTRVGDRPTLLYAPDAPGPCYAFDAETLGRETVWAEPGGTMAMVSLPYALGDFLAVQRFNPGFHAERAELAVLHHTGPSKGSWAMRTLFEMPYLHRFDILERGGIRYLLCCTVCSAKEYEQDWRSPGRIYAAELSEGLERPIELSVVAEGMTRNHGYWRVSRDGLQSALTACDQGVFAVQPPERRGLGWTVRRVLEKPVSDIALCDIDGDGEDELAAIEPFHGESFVVYHRSGTGWEEMYRRPDTMSFCHVVWGGKLRGESVFLGGCRGEGRELFMLRWRSGTIVSETIEEGAGPSNVAVLPGPDRDLLLVANREIGEAALYVVHD